eukprot:TRINITY_DN8375_c0_g1_i2.p1 TRINITY_DN8375_c0_g1~~TRINITY_DN8375_c0_g1_i2.p1  ORF type:complete len:827 (+),score=26.05 TRINITY_DN8375_c0_g1_i2:358-2481(+)
MAEMSVVHCGVVIFWHSYNETFLSPLFAAARNAYLFSNLILALLCIWLGAASGNVHMLWIGMCDFVVTMGSVCAVWAEHVIVSATSLIVVETHNASFYVASSWETFVVKIIKWFCVVNVCLQVGAYAGIAYDDFVHDTPSDDVGIFHRLALMRLTGFHVLAAAAIALGIADHLTSWARHMVYFPLFCHAYAYFIPSMAAAKCVIAWCRRDEQYYVAMGLGDLLNCVLVVGLLQALRDKHHVFSLSGDPPCGFDSRRFSTMLRCWHIARESPIHRSRFTRGACGIYAISFACVIVLAPLESLLVQYGYLVASDGGKATNRCLYSGYGIAFNIMIHNTAYLYYADMQTRIHVWWQIRENKAYCLGRLLGSAVLGFVMRALVTHRQLLFLNGAECSLDGFETFCLHLMNVRVILCCILLALAPLIVWTFSLKEDEMLTGIDVRNLIERSMKAVANAVANAVGACAMYCGAPAEIGAKAWLLLSRVPQLLIFPVGQPQPMSYQMERVTAVRAASYSRIGVIRGANLPYFDSKVFAEIQAAIDGESERVTAYLNGETHRLFLQASIFVAASLALRHASLEMPRARPMPGYDAYDKGIFHMYIGLSLSVAFYRALVFERVAQSQYFASGLIYFTAMLALMFLMWRRWLLGIDASICCATTGALLWLLRKLSREMQSAGLLPRSLNNVWPFVIQPPREVMLEQIVGAFAIEDPE